MSFATKESTNSSNPESFDDLRRKVSLASSDLHQLAKSPQLLRDRVAYLNREGVARVLDNKYQESNVYFSEAERNLEYAASCGSNIDRVLITTTLKNKACVNQRFWEMGVSSDYMDALIRSLQCYHESEPAIELTESVKDKKSCSFEDISKIIKRRLFTASCLLQNSALVSQTGDHQAARRSAISSLSNFQVACSFLLDYEKAVSGKNSELMVKLKDGCELLDNRNSLDKLMRKAKSEIFKLKKHRQFLCFDPQPIVNMNIGSLMQIPPITVEDASKPSDPDWLISQVGIVSLAMEISCALFAVAAETRLLGGDVDDKKRRPQNMTESQMYHIQAITLLARITRLQTKLLTHLMKSFRNHFGIDLEYEDAYFQQFSSISLHSSRDLIGEEEGLNLLEDIQEKKIIDFNESFSSAEINKKLRSPSDNFSRAVNFSERKSEETQVCEGSHPTVLETPIMPKPILKKTIKNAKSRSKQPKGVLAALSKSNSKSKQLKTARSRDAKTKNKLTKVKSQQHLSSRTRLNKDYFGNGSKEKRGAREAGVKAVRSPGGKRAAK